MTDLTVAAVAAVPQPAAARTGPSSGASAAPSPALRPEARKPPPPISVDVARGGNDVFIYTLRDPATDTVLAIIPTEEVSRSRVGSTVDTRA